MTVHITSRARTRSLSQPRQNARPFLITHIVAFNFVVFLGFMLAFLSHRNIASNPLLRATDISSSTSSISPLSSGPLAKGFASLPKPPRRDATHELPTPHECAEWRRLARQPDKLRLYRRHFTSHDVTDWLLYAALFSERWHAGRSTRPSYLDVAANHARRWSATWFFDRCMGWDGVCVEPNSRYWPELRTQRHCRLVSTCVSDRVRTVNFSRAAAYGGVVADPHAMDLAVRHGVNITDHTTDRRFRQLYDGVETLNCTTLGAVARARARDSSQESSYGHTHFDFLSLDVEGHELPAALGVDWGRTTIDVIVTENRTPLMRAFLNRRGYDLMRDVLKDDLWIRRGSGLRLDPVVVRWMRRFNRRTFLFEPESTDLAEMAMKKETAEAGSG